MPDLPRVADAQVPVDASMGDAADWCADLAAAQDAAIARCALLVGLAWEAPAACVLAAPASPPRFDGALAADCLRTLAGRSCEDLADAARADRAVIELPSTCAEAFVGTAGVGAPCHADICRPGLVCTQGPDCRRCREAVPPGGRCSVVALCAEGLDCVDGSCQDAPPRFVLAGERCGSGGATCALGLGCVEREDGRFCRVRSPRGTPCRRADECVWEEVHEGTSRLVTCLDGRCDFAPAAGEACAPEFPQCARDDFCRRSTGTCAPAAREGEPCDEVPCADGLYCQFDLDFVGTCAPGLAGGERCATGIECASDRHVELDGQCTCLSHWDAACP